MPLDSARRPGAWTISTAPPPCCAAKILKTARPRDFRSMTPTLTRSSKAPPTRWRSSRTRKCRLTLTRSSPVRPAQHPGNHNRAETVTHKMNACTLPFGGRLHIFEELVHPDFTDSAGAVLHLKVRKLPQNAEDATKRIEIPEISPFFVSRLVCVFGIEGLPVRIERGG